MLQPLGDRILVRQKVEERKKSGIIIEEEYIKKIPMGEIVAVGPEANAAKNGIVLLEGSACRLEIGNIVLFRDISGEKVKDGDEELLILKCSEVLAKIL